MLQLKYPTDFFSSDCLTFSLSKPKKKKPILWYRKRKEKKRKEKRTCDLVGNRTASHHHPLPDLDNQSVLWYREREGEKKKGLQSSGGSCDQTFVPEVLRYGDRDWPLGSPPICSVFSFRKWGFCWEIHLGIIYDSRIVVWLVMI